MVHQLTYSMYILSHSQQITHLAAVINRKACLDKIVSHDNTTHRRKKERVFLLMNDNKQSINVVQASHSIEFSRNSWKENNKSDSFVKYKSFNGGRK